jgi:hypothetical protein
LFKFKPSSFSSLPEWSKTNNYCGQLGLAFGRDQKLLYSLSWFNSNITVALIDIYGNSLWEYKTLGGLSYSSLITYKEIDSLRDMSLSAS